MGDLSESAVLILKASVFAHKQVCTCWTRVAQLKPATKNLKVKVVFDSKFEKQKIDIKRARSQSGRQKNSMFEQVKTSCTMLKQ